jgi:hypothetical protein
MRSYNVNYCLINEINQKEIIITMRTFEVLLSKINGNTIIRLSFDLFVQMYNVISHFLMFVSL